MGASAMLKYLVWRLMFELCNLRRLFGHGSERVQYLAFGANLSADIMRERRIKPLAARPYTLTDYGLRFDHPSPWVGCSYASAEPAPGESLHGQLYTLSVRDAARMDYYELEPIVKRYRRTWVEQDGEVLYFYQTNRSTPDLSPTPEYLGYIANGLAQHPDVSAEYHAALSATDTALPGQLVSSYLGEQPNNRTAWKSALVVAYQRLTLLLFVKVLYRFSLTIHCLRH